MRWTSRHPVDVCSALLSRAYRDTIHSQLSTLTFYPQIQRFLPRIHQQCDEGFLGQRPVPKNKYNVILINETIQRCLCSGKWYSGLFDSCHLEFFCYTLSPKQWLKKICEGSKSIMWKAFPQSFLEIIFILCTVLCTVGILSTLPCV